MVGSFEFFLLLSHIGGRADFLLSLPFSRHHFVNQCISRFYGTFVKGAA